MIPYRHKDRVPFVHVCNAHIDINLHILPHLHLSRTYASVLTFIKIPLVNYATVVIVTYEARVI